MEAREDFVETPMGRKLHFLRPTAGEIHLDDIAKGLSRIRRFNGTAERFCSIAEHSVRLFYWFRQDMTFTDKLFRSVLFHDASEAYLGDIPGPVKRHLPDYKRLEYRLMGVIAERFDFPWPLPSLVGEADFRILNDERRQLLRPSGNVWLSDDLEPLGITFGCWSETEAERQFLKSYQLCGLVAAAAE